MQLLATGIASHHIALHSGQQELDRKEAGGQARGRGGSALRTHRDSL